MSKLTGAALDRAVANALGLKSVNNCEKWRNSMDDEDDDIQDYKKPWAGLTVQERNDCLVQADPCECLADPEAHQLMVEVEAKLRSKNT